MTSNNEKQSVESPVRGLVCTRDVDSCCSLARPQLWNISNTPGGNWRLLEIMNKRKVQIKGHNLGLLQVVKQEIFFDVLTGSGGRAILFSFI